MRALALPLLFLGAACQQHASPPGALPAAPASGAVTAPSPAAPAPPWTAAQEACVDRWLAERGLDSYGSPQGTQYAGGTPLFDETTGVQRSRREYLAKRHPEALHSCGL